MEKKQQSSEASLEDLKAIRYMLGKYEEKPILESWAFFTWSFFITIGTILNWILHTVRPLTVVTAFFHIWVPIMIVGILFETIAFLSRFKKDQVPINAKNFIKTIVFLGGFFSTSSFILYSLISTNAPLPGVILAWIASAFFIIGYLSYSSLFYTALLLFIISIPFLSGNWTSAYAYLATGGISAIAFGIGGIQYSLAGRKAHE